MQLAASSAPLTGPKVKGGEDDVANRNGKARSPVFAMSPKLRKELRKTARLPPGLHHSGRHTRRQTGVATLPDARFGTRCKGSL